LLWRNMSKIVVFGDTHLVDGEAADLSRDLVSAIADCDLAIHTGDIVSVSTLEMIQGLTDLVAVYGNQCHSEVRLRLRRREIVELDGVRIGILHGDGAASSSQAAHNAFRGERLDVVVFGHSHRRLKQVFEDRLLLNPGSVCQPRGDRRSYAILDTHPELTAGFVLLD